MTHMSMDVTLKFGDTEVAVGAIDVPLEVESLESEGGMLPVRLFVNPDMDGFRQELAGLLRKVADAVENPSPEPDDT